MTFVDANLLLYAQDTSCHQNEAATRWWDDRLSGTDPVCLCWVVINAFVRISTNSRVFEHPLTVSEACSRVSSWLDQPCVRILHATERHWTVLEELLVDGQAAGNLVTDAHLAAVAIEHGCTLYSTDADFARFRTLKWVNPLQPKRSRR